MSPFLRKHLSLISLLASLGTATSCANYIARMHREFDEADGLSEEAQHPTHDQFNLYRQKRRMNPGEINSNTQSYVAPRVKRLYGNPQKRRKRYRAQDLIDSQNKGSLWANPQGYNTNLFTNSGHRGNGDIILIQVAQKMKDEITAELKRAFPAPEERKSSSPSPLANEENASSKTTPKANENKGEKRQKIYDKISSVVVEEVNKNHLLLRGRKSLLYQNRKRTLEIQALISQRDIAADDTINSDKIIETNINIIR